MDGRSSLFGQVLQRGKRFAEYSVSTKPFQRIIAFLGYAPGQEDRLNEKVQVVPDTG